MVSTSASSSGTSISELCSNTSKNPVDSSVDKAERKSVDVLEREAEVQRTIEENNVIQNHIRV
jgi:hypothetical protein